MIEVWGRTDSSNVAKVMWTLDEISLSHLRHDCGGRFGGVADSTYRAMNPNGTVPTLRDGALVLWESNAIVRYLAGRSAPDALWPADPVVRAGADRWMDWASITLAPRFLLYRRQSAAGGPTAAAPDLADQVRSMFAILEGALTEDGFLVGDRLTIADIALGVHVHRFMTGGGMGENWRNLARYYAKLLSRTAYRTHVASAVN